MPKKSAIYGTVVNHQGQGSPALVEAMPVGLHDKAGYEPEVLDPIIQTLLTNAQQGASFLANSAPMMLALLADLEGHVKALLATAPLPDEDEDPGSLPPGFRRAIKAAHDISRIMERVQRVSSGATKALDDASRLRTFLATGDTNLGGLEGLSETQLRRIVVGAAEGFLPTGEG